MKKRNSKRYKKILEKIKDKDKAALNVEDALKKVKEKLFIRMEAKK